MKIIDHIIEHIFNQPNKAPQEADDYVALTVNGVIWEVDRKSLEALMVSFLELKGKLKVKP